MLSRKFAIRLLGAGVMLGLVVVALMAFLPRSRLMDQLVPLYQPGASDWHTACADSPATGAGSFVIASFDQDPAPGLRQAWAQVINGCRRWGRAKVLGYVWTDYGTLSPASIQRQIRAWYQQYPGQLGGIFFDGVSDRRLGDGAYNHNLYASLAGYVHARHGARAEVVFNFGAAPASAWMLRGPASQRADIVVTFEGTKQQLVKWSQPAWEERYPKGDFAVLVHNWTGPAGPVCEVVRDLHIGYLYVGDNYEKLVPNFRKTMASCGA